MLAAVRAGGPLPDNLTGWAYGMRDRYRDLQVYDLAGAWGLTAQWIEALTSQGVDLGGTAPAFPPACDEVPQEMAKEAT